MILGLRRTQTAYVFWLALSPGYTRHDPHARSVWATRQLTTKLPHALSRPSPRVSPTGPLKILLQPVPDD